MIILKERGAYLDDKSGGDGLTGGIIRLFSRNARNYNKGRRGEDTIINVLQDLDDSCYLINDVILPSSSGNIDHILLTPKGIFAMETKHWDGRIICHGDEWLRRYQTGFFSSMDFTMGSPSKQVKRNAFNLSEIIKAGVFHNAFRVWVEGLVVFTHPNVHLELNEPSVTILKANKLFNYITNFMQIRTPKSPPNNASVGSPNNALLHELFMNICQKSEVIRNPQMSELSKNDLQSIGDFIIGAKDRPIVPHEPTVLRRQLPLEDGLTLKTPVLPPDQVLRTLREHGDSMGRWELARSLQIKLSELDSVLKDLEQAGKVKLTEIEGCRVGGIRGRPMIIDYLSQPPEKIPKAPLPFEEKAKKKGWWQFWK